MEARPLGSAGIDNITARLWCAREIGVCRFGVVRTHQDWVRETSADMPTSGMGLQADIFVSIDEEANAYDTTPERFVDRAEYKDFTPLELSTLWSIVRDTEWDVDSMDEFACLLEIDGGERLIHSLPSAMISELAALPPDRFASVTTAWAATEEMDCNPENVRPIVEDLVRLTRLALDSGRGVYLWNSL